MHMVESPGKYKTIDALRTDPSFQCFTAVNIEEAGQTRVVICRFQDAGEVRRLLPIFYTAQEWGCDELLEIVVEYGGFYAVFAQCEGLPLAKVLSSADPPLRRRIEEALFVRALELSRLPPALYNAVAQAENALWQPDGEKLVFPFQPCPALLQEGDGFISALSQLSEQILHRSWKSMVEELDFLDLLRDGAIKTAAQGYAAWRALCADTAQLYEVHDARNIFSQIAYWLKTHLGRKKRKKGCTTSGTGRF